jgi:hypothetical protein
MELFHFNSVAGEIDSERSIIEVQLAMRRKPSAIAPVVDQLMRVIKAGRGIGREDRTMETALHEAFKVAMVGCGFASVGDIQVKCRCEADKEVLVTISLASAPGAVTLGPAASVASASRDLGNDRGIWLIKRCVDEVHLSDDGTALHLRKRFAVPA